MINIKQSYAAKAVVSVSDQQNSFQLTITETPVVIIAGAMSDVNNNDIVQHTQTSASILNTGYINAISAKLINPIFTAITPSIATVDTIGVISYVSSGTAEFKVTVGNLSKTIKLNIGYSTPTSTVISVSWVAGSLGGHSTTIVDDAIAGKTKASNGDIYTVNNINGTVFTRNTNCWANIADLTCISPYNTQYANLRAGTLITPQHIISAAHYELAVGSDISFVTQDGSDTIISRTILSKERHPDYNPTYPDLTIYTLDSPLPNTITPCKVLPISVFDKLVESEIAKVPCLCLDQEEKAIVTDLNVITQRAAGSSQIVHFTRCTEPQRMLFDEDKIVGDSGNPSFMLVNTGGGPELVLLTVWTGGGGGHGTALVYHNNDMNQMILDADTQAGVSTGYTLTEIDLSSFPTYP